MSGPLLQRRVEGCTPVNALAAGEQVAQGQATEVAHLSLIEVGGIRLLLLVNSAALRRLASRSAAFSL